MSVEIQHATRQAFLDPIYFHMFLVAVTPKLQHRTSNALACCSAVVYICLVVALLKKGKAPDPTSVLATFFLDRLDTLP